MQEFLSESDEVCISCTAVLILTDCTRFRWIYFRLIFFSIQSFESCTLKRGKFFCKPFTCVQLAQNCTTVCFLLHNLLRLFPVLSAQSFVSEMLVGGMRDI